MRILWCEEHDPKEGDTTSDACHLGIEQGDTKACRMVPMRLIPEDVQVATMSWGGRTCWIIPVDALDGETP